MVVPIPVGVRDDVRRLGMIARTTQRLKDIAPPPASAFFRYAWIQRAFMRYVRRQRVMNIYVANVPGPPVPLYLSGARCLEILPVVPLSGNQTLAVGALSYAGRFAISVVADPETCPDVEVFAGAVRRSLDALGVAVSVPTAP